jgi:hypothetical protein
MSQKFVFSYTQLYAPVRSYTQLYSAIRSCTQQLFSYTPAQSENRVNARFQAENYIREKRKTVPSCSSHGRQWSSVVASGRQNAISGRQWSPVVVRTLSVVARRAPVVVRSMPVVVSGRQVFATDYTVSNSTAKT